VNTRSHLRGQVVGSDARRAKIYGAITRYGDAQRVFSQRGGNWNPMLAPIKMEACTSMRIRLTDYRDE
jgi:hypothetical protein